VDAAAKFGFQSGMDHAVALKAASAGKSRGFDVNAKMGSATGILPGAVRMALMHMRFIVDLELLGRKNLTQSGDEDVCGGHNPLTIPVLKP